MNESIYIKLKFIVIAMGILIISALILLTILLINKKKHKSNSEVNKVTLPLGKTINLLENNIPSSCTPIEVIFKENYIAIYSKKCNLIKIINIK